MNLKALVTTLVLGSSTLASADAVKVTGSVGIEASVGHARPVAPNYRPAPAPVEEACGDHAPGYQPAPSRPVLQAPPVWKGPTYRITNTVLTRSASLYRGAITPSKLTRLHGRPVVGAHGFVAQRSQPWFDLTEATRIDNGREVFALGADKGLFTKLKLQALGAGSSTISHVLVEFADGREGSQIIRVNRVLNRADAAFTIDLEGRYRLIKRIVVYGTTDQGSAYKLQAR